MEFEYIQHEADLEIFCKDAAQQDWLAIDSEFIREKTYYPNLCLIQIATSEKIVCIDTLSLTNLKPLKELLFSPKTTKVFHAASQDLEILYNLYNDTPNPVFDTQIAASALGYGEQVSYAYIVKKICNVTIDKSLSRTAWNKRPLNNKEIQYAVDDVKYLAKVYLQLTNELKSKNRTHWVSEECQRICTVENYIVNPGELWKSVKGVGKLEPNQLIVLKYLASWRDHQAKKENKPRQWILRDKSLRALAIQQPKIESELLEIEEITNLQRKIYAVSILQCIKQGLRTPKDLWPEKDNCSPLDRKQRRLIKYALEFIRNRAEEQSISPNMLATRSIVEKLIRGHRDLPILCDWRLEIIGNDLIKLLESNKIN